MFWLLRQSPSTSEDESGSTSEESHAGYATARLSALSLESLHCLGGSPDQSSYAANGMNRKRMKSPETPMCMQLLSAADGLGKNMFDFLGAAKVWSRCCSLVVASQHWRYENSVDERRIGWWFSNTGQHMVFLMFKRIMFNIPLSIGVPAIASPYRIWSVPGGMAPPGWGG